MLANLNLVPELHKSIVSLCLLVIQSIETRAREEGCMQACTIGLSIDEDPKLEKGKEKNSNAARSMIFIQSPSYVRVT